MPSNNTLNTLQQQLQQQQQKIQQEIDENNRKLKEIETKHSNYLRKSIRWNKYLIPITLIMGISVLYIGITDLYVGFRYWETGNIVDGIINTLLGLVNIWLSYYTFKQNKKFKEEYEQRVCDGI